MIKKCVSSYTDGRQFFLFEFKSVNKSLKYLKPCYVVSKLKNKTCAKQIVHQFIDFMR